MAYLFKTLLEMRWTDTFSSSFRCTIRGTEDSTIGFPLKPVDDQFIADLIEAADELDGGKPEVLDELVTLNG